MTDHNPYVGIQRTVFEQGYQRALKEVEKRLPQPHVLNTAPTPHWTVISIIEAVKRA